MSKQYAHLHAMAKTSVKFQNDWPKTVGGVALTTPISHLRANAGATKKVKHQTSTKYLYFHKITGPTPFSGEKIGK